MVHKLLYSTCSAFSSMDQGPLSHCYIKYAGGVGYFDERFIEYDLDVEDVKWLEAFNRGQQRLPQRRFELLLWRLEVANAEATDAALAAAGEPNRHVWHAFLHVSAIYWAMPRFVNIISTIRPYFGPLARVMPALLLLRDARSTLIHCLLQPRQACCCESQGLHRQSGRASQRPQPWTT